MATTSNSILTAARDNDLRERLVAIAAREGIDNPQAWVEARMWQLTAVPVTDNGDTVASVYEYGAGEYAKAVAALPPAPGKNPAIVTDNLLAGAVKKLNS